MPEMLKHGVRILVIGLIFVLMAYFFLDKPIFYFAYQHHFRRYAIYDYFTKLIVVFGVLPLLFYPYIIIRLAYEKYSKIEGFLLVFSNSIAIAFFLKVLLKLICSRYWPMSCNDTASLVTNNAYGFNWFEFSVLNNAFPSGHATVVFAGLTAIALCFPKTIGFICIISVFILLGLIAEHYHFLSDIVAGAALGYLVAYYTVQIAREKI